MLARLTSSKLKGLRLGLVLAYAHTLAASDDIIINYGGEMAEGSAIITSCSGTARLTDESGEQKLALSQDILIPEGLAFTTTDDSRLFFTFSNGVAVGMDHDTQITCLQYSQRPFDAEDQALGLEPSISRLRLRLDSGQIAIASNRLSPLSDLRVVLPNGEIRLHKGTCLIRLGKTGIHITAFEGNLTYYYPDQKTREFVSAPSGIRISDQSIVNQDVAENFTAADFNEVEEQICKATRHASRRVTFQPNQDTDAPPIPLMIVRPDYFQQTPARPYQFSK